MLCKNDECIHYNDAYTNNCKIRPDAAGCESFLKEPSRLEKLESVAKLQCSDGLCHLRPDGEPHPAMKTIYAYVDEIEDKEPERADDICSIAMQLEKKLWELDKVA